MKKYAVLIGNSQFPDEPDQKKLPTLACPERDVDDLAGVLADVNRGEFDVVTLKNQASYQVLQKLQKTIKQLQADDLLLVYYSGHGKPNKSNILHLTTFDTVINELESTAIPIHRVYDIIATGKAKKIIIILDCCYSGAAGQGFRGDINDGLQQLNNARGTYLVTASTELQVAHENTSDGYGLFTKHLIAGLTTGDADKDGDGFISMNELYDYVHDKVIAENPNQQPTKHVKEERGSLMIAKSGRDSHKEQHEKLEAFFLDLKKQKRIANDILSTVLALLDRKEIEFSELERHRYTLALAIYEAKIDAVGFVREWDKLQTFSGDKPKVESPAISKQKYVWGIIIALLALAYPVAKVINSQLKHDEPDMVFIKGGTFLMGSPETEKDRQDLEKLHSVTVGDFYMGKAEVTKSQFAKFVNDSGYKTEAETGNGCWSWEGSDWKINKTYSWRNPGFKQDDNHPVVCVSWNDAQAYIAWLNKITGKYYHLPTEAEWEYAARAGTTTAFFTGENITKQQANFDGTNTTAIGSYPANPWGLYDMAGNALEWTCSDNRYYGDDAESRCSTSADPKSGRVLRGGAWIDGARYVRSAYRNMSVPIVRSPSTGFRFVLDQ